MAKTKEDIYAVLNNMRLLILEHGMNFNNGASILIDSLQKDITRIIKSNKLITDEKVYAIPTNNSVDGDIFYPGQGFLKIDNPGIYGYLPINEISFVKVKDRAELEFNPYYRQICVASVLVDMEDKRILTLKNKEGLFKDKYTMTQGHVKFDLERGYTQSFMKFIYEEMCREIREEIKCTDDGIDIMAQLRINKLPSIVISNNRDFTAREHIGFIYIQEESSSRFDEIVKTLETNEPDKHDLEVITAKEYLKCCSWLQMIIDIVYNS